MAEEPADMSRGKTEMHLTTKILFYVQKAECRDIGAAKIQLSSEGGVFKSVYICNRVQFINANQPIAWQKASEWARKVI